MVEAHRLHHSHDEIVGACADDFVTVTPPQHAPNQRARVLTFGCGFSREVCALRMPACAGVELPMFMAFSKSEPRAD
jgi:hypothetical protein